MSKGPFEVAIADLEKSNQQPDLLLNKAAKLINVNLQRHVSSCTANVLYQTDAVSAGFKEQWLLRWLLKKLTVPVQRENPGDGSAFRDSFISSPLSWSLFLTLTSSIPKDVCLEILQERKFYDAITQILRTTLKFKASFPGSETLNDYVQEPDGPPAKKRKLSPDLPSQPNNSILWILLQATCRSVELLILPHDRQSTASHNLSSAWTTGWSQRAALFGALLDTIASVAANPLPSQEQRLLSNITSTAIQLWAVGGLNSRGQSDDPNRAFTSHCLMPSLITLDLLQGPEFDSECWMPVIQSLERLVALHVILPGRSLFNERHAKKWKSIDNLVYFEHLKGFLADFQKTIIDVAAIRTYITENFMTPTNIYLLKNLFDITLRCVPSKDLAKHRSEQTWFDALFLGLVHTLWIGIPQVTSSGVATSSAWSGSSIEMDSSLLIPVESLVDIAVTRHVRTSLPVLGHLLSAQLSLDAKSTPWPLLAKILEIDVNILLPKTGLDASKGLLDQLCSVIEEGSASRDVYASISDTIIVRLLKGFATSRDIDGFISIWREGLQNAMRTRSRQTHQSDRTPTVLAWEEIVVFDELEKVVQFSAPSSLGPKLLERVMSPLQALNTKVGSTVEEMADLAIFSAYLRSCSGHTEKPLLDDEQINNLAVSIINALERRSDYQTQRWRLWSFIHDLIQYRPNSQALETFQCLFTASYSFVSLEQLEIRDQGKSSQFSASKCLECLEAFSVLLSGSLHAPAYRSILKTELSHLVKALRDVTRGTDNAISETWNGQSYECDSAIKVLIACLGRLLQNLQILSISGDLFAGLISESLEVLGAIKFKELEGPPVPRLDTLLEAIIMSDEALNNPSLRAIMVDHFSDKAGKSFQPGTMSTSLFRQLPLAVFKKPRIRKLVTNILQSLQNESAGLAVEEINDQLAMILELDSVAPGSAIDASSWRLWVDISEKFSSNVDLDSSMASIAMRNLLSRILERVWNRALVSKDSEDVSKLVSWTVNTIEQHKGKYHDEMPFLAMQVFLSQGLRSTSLLEDPATEKTFEKARRRFIRMLKHNSRQASQNGLDTKCLMNLKILMDAMADVKVSTESDEFHDEVDAIEDLIATRQLWIDTSVVPLPEDRLMVSVRHLLHSRVELESILGPTEQTVHLRLRGLFSAMSPQTDLLVDHVGLLADKVELAICDFTGSSYAYALAFLRKEGRGTTLDLSPIASALIVSRVEEFHLTQNSNLVSELAELACLSSLTRDYSLTHLLLALNNSKYILERHPLAINQSTLDRLLSTLCQVVSADDDTKKSFRQARSEPEAADIFSRVCDVIGVVLSRHRRRISDRYHLLVPLLQSMMRCLFWPGLLALNAMPTATAVNGLTLFGQSLPIWQRESAKGLPSVSSEQLSRILTSICNPTVSAARSTKRSGFNELNDETKKARQLAGRHLHYLLAEYARCSLDGQIDPSVKESLMPGLFSILDATDQDLMKASNASMDVGSRAIFKTLYSDWSKYGKWDKN
ncbi:hypothetical protein PV10_00953 [Exophiala mesophila]|uniref:Nucleolar 27S pre-rRNA processing Urb2/Npa2 C-terminal domain-containing protein n=1 Tax=Exophiala mesophila TaxID=212818 RepID=A0A0D1Y912_EXOME|nr:uncharacterized protein PV10_00953 [Exophiala mesophila]KIV97171.1 hypothetical protein PV10_00953 [Exophiala mesophila]